MVFLAVTPTGLQDALRHAASSDAAIWCGADAISEADFDALDHRNLTRFSYELGGREDEVMDGAIETINEHHPTESVWVEAT